MTSAVGIFPEGKSLDGLEEMSGNLWQLCIDADEDGLTSKIRRLLHFALQAFLHRKQNLNTLRVMAADRVMRGGSWLSDAFNCRSARRYGNAPGFRSDDVGFRLSRTLPSALLPSGRDRNAS